MATSTMLTALILGSQNGGGPNLSYLSTSPSLPELAGGDGRLFLRLNPTPDLVL